MPGRYGASIEAKRGRYPMCNSCIGHNLRNNLTRRSERPILRALGWDKSTLSRVQNGIRPLSLSEALILDVICQIPIARLIAEAPVGT